MKKIIKVILVFFVTFILFSENANAKEKVKIYFFNGDGCPHCAEEEILLKKIKRQYNNVLIESYEVWNNKKNQKLMEKVKEKFNIKTNGVPLTVISSTAMVGYSDANDVKIKRIISYYLNNSSVNEDVVGKIKNNNLDDKEIIDQFELYDKKTNSSSTLKLPFIGKVNMKDVSIPTAAAVIGLVDGFNPCAMWVLLFLISMLLGMKNRKRMWVLGISFLFTSAIVYMAIMLSWINIVVNMSTSIIFRNIIAIIAIIGSVINLRSFMKSKENGCEVVDSTKRKKIFTKIKKFTTEKSFILALLGIIGLAISVNIIELACSAGLPLVFTQILALNKITGLEAFLYTVVYIIFFLLDDIVVFTVAMVTARVAAISTKYNKYSHLIGGILMFLIGILLILKPEWLMFNFK